MSVNDYNIVSILGNNINSTTYKVEHKETREVFVWKIIDYENIKDTNKEYLSDKLNKRKLIRHPNIVGFYDYIDQVDNKTLYIVTEYCENGSLKNLIDSCIANNTRLTEEFMCKILYQIAFTLKTTDYAGELTTKEIFLDKNHNVKLLNFKLSCSKDKIFKESKVCHLGYVLYEICTLKTFSKNSFENDLKHITNTYSNNLLSLLVSLLKDKSDLKNGINKILCHYTVLLKSAQWIEEKSFINNGKFEKRILITKENSTQDEYTLKLEELRSKERSLQVREQKLNEWEYRLITKEKKILLTERTVKEKLQQAELYLKRCRESKSVSSETTKSSISAHPHEKKTYENLDSTYVSCGDSILLPTSSKLNVNKIIKPAPFTRTLSERRIRFKGHSPLKEIDFNKKRNIKPKSQKAILFKNNSEWLTCSEENDKSSIEGSSKAYNKAKRLFSTKNRYENNYLKGGDDMQCNSIIWTEENKKYAFELLRMMNTDKENQPLEVKHTHL